MKRSTFKLPNRLICDVCLSPSARKVGAVLYAYRNALGFCTKSLDTLAALSDCCTATVRKAIEELTAAGYISVARTYRYLPRKGRLVYGRMAYQVNLSFTGGYTMIPRSFLTWRENGEELTSAAFVVCLYLFLSAGNSRRAFPSISRIGRMVGIARSTVCRALLTIKSMTGFLVRLCRKRSGAFAANSYNLVTVLAAPRRSIASASENPISPQGAAGRNARRTRDVLHTIIVKLKDAVHNLFSRKRVVRFLANNS